MQAVNPANIATTNYNRKWKSRGKLIVCATNFQAGRDSWIGEDSEIEGKKLILCDVISGSYYNL